MKTKKLAGIMKFPYLYECGIFVVLTVMLIFTRTDISEYYASYFLVDYSHGYITNGLVGEIISWFTDYVPRALMLRIFTVMAFLLIFAASLLFGKLIKSCTGEIKTAVLIMTGMTILSPFTFSWLFGSAGRWDINFYAVTLFALLFMKNKYLRWLIPVLCVVGTMMSVVYSVHCMTLCAIVLLYEFSKKPKVDRGVLCFLTYGGIIAVSLYAIATHNKLSFANTQELMDYLYSKTDITAFADDLPRYYDMFTMPLTDFTAKYIWDDMEKRVFLTIFGFLFVFLPLMLIFGKIWIKCMKRTDNKLSRFIYFLCIAAMFVPWTVAIYSGEVGRWSSTGYSIEFGLLFYMLYDKNETVTAVFEEFLAYIKKHYAVFALLLAFYSMLAGAAFQA